MKFLPDELKIMVHWIVSREAVRAAKEAGLPKPWTDDPLLRDYKWCNVRRMDDRVSRDLMANWYTQDLEPAEAVIAATAARYVNWVPTLLDCTDDKPYGPGCLAGLGSVLQRRSECKEKVFTGAYMIPGVAGKLKCESVPAVIRHVQSGNFWCPSQEGTWKRLIEVPGLGSFIAGQIVADVAFLKAGLSWPDREEWAPVGPGSARGLNRLLGRDLNKTVPQAMFVAHLGPLIEALCQDDRVAAIRQDRGLVAMDFQNCACEYDKHRRLTLGQGKVRATYPGCA